MTVPCVALGRHLDLVMCFYDIVGYQNRSDILALVFYTVDIIRVLFTSYGFVDDYATLYSYLVMYLFLVSMHKGSDIVISAFLRLSDCVNFPECERITVESCD